MHKEIIIQPLPVRVGNVILRYECLIKRVDDGVVIDERNLWFEYSDFHELSPQQDSDQFLLAMLMDGMREQRTLRINGKVSLSLLRNLQDFQLYWNFMKPEIYSPIEVQTEISVPRGKVNEKSVCAFSGGIDSSFSVWRPSQRDISLAVMVHGFDITLDNTESFERLYRRWVHPLKKIGIQLIALRTNFREVSLTPWEDVHAAAITAGLNRYKTVVGNVIIGSSKTYRNLSQIWGSNPTTDNLLGSSDFSIYHDGASYRRIDKVKVVSDWNECMKNLHICWEGDIQDENCGICEKCVRTKMIFMIQGLKVPEVFQENIPLETSLRRITLKYGVIYTVWNEIHHYLWIHRRYRWYLSVGLMIKRSKLQIGFGIMKKRIRSLMKFR